MVRAGPVITLSRCVTALSGWYRLSLGRDGTVVNKPASSPQLSAGGEPGLMRNVKVTGCSRPGVMKPQINSRAIKLGGAVQHTPRDAQGSGAHRGSGLRGRSGAQVPGVVAISRVFLQGLLCATPEGYPVPSVVEEAARRTRILQNPQKSPGFAGGVDWLLRAIQR